jgi:hypothetical protein
MAAAWCGYARPKVAERRPTPAHTGSAHELGRKQSSAQRSLADGGTQSVPVRRPRRRTDRVLGERGNNSGYEGISSVSEIGVAFMAVWSPRGGASRQHGRRGVRLTGVDRR